MTSSMRCGVLVSIIEDLLSEVDERWRPVDNHGKIVLNLIGQTALFLQTGYDRGTKDGDVLETHAVTGAVWRQLEDLAGIGTAIAARHGMYIDVVGSAIPLLPRDPIWHRYPLELQHFDTRVLDIADVLVSKLVRYISTDRDDIRAMVEYGHVDHGHLLERFELVLEHYQFDGRADRLPSMVARFNEVERDLFLVDESEFDLHPSVYQ